MNLRKALGCATFVLLLVAGPALAQSVIVRKPDNSAAIDVANTANQVTANTSLGSIDTKLTSQATAANQASQLAQETALNTVLGLQADAAWSGSGSGTLQAIQKYIAAKLEASRALLAGTLTVQFGSPQAVTQSGTWNVTNISGTVSLPTGAATAANQATTITSLGTIVTNTTGASTAAAQATANTTLSTIATNTSGASTAANQTSANTKLDQLHTDMIAATPAGTNLIGKVGLDQTTPGTTNGVVVNSSALPTGAATSAAQATAQTSLAQLHTDMIAATPAGTNLIGKVGIDQTTPGTTNVVSPQYGASGVSAVTAALTSATSTSTFTPVAGRGFNVSGWGTFVASYQLERTFDSGTTWLPITAGGTQLYQWTAAASEQAEEAEASVGYRVRVTSYTSGTLNLRLSQ